MAGERMPESVKNTVKFEVGEEIELTEHRAMVYLPESAVKVVINATVFECGELHNVSKELSLEDIRKAFQKADDGYIDDDDVFVLTDKGAAYLEDAGRP